MTRHFLTLADLGGGPEIEHILARSAELKRLRGQQGHPRPLSNKSVALIFEKASTRTRVSFEVGVHELGGQPLALAGRDLQLGRGEPLSDTARVLSRYVHALVVRTSAHARLEELSKHATAPVINALTDDHHPCQLLADLLTMKTAFGQVRGKRVAWIGDGNNMANSWMDAATLLGFDLVLACPEGYRPKDALVQQFRAREKGSITFETDPKIACSNADVVTTDVWASMGQEGESAERAKAFLGYIVDDACMRRAAPHAIFLHCLPAHRDEEVSESVLEGPQSRVWEEAENRLHTQKALLEWALSG